MPLEAQRPVVLKDLKPYPDFDRRAIVACHPGVDQIFELAGLNPANPLGDWIRPGMRVLVKPNWVRHAAQGWSSLEALTTHPSIIRPVVEAVAKALRDRDGVVRGEIILADAPLQSADFERLMAQCGIPLLVEHWKAQGISLLLADLRRVIAATDDSTGVVSSTRGAAGDPRGDTVVDLGTDSRLDNLLIPGGGLGVSNYDSTTTTGHHSRGTHRYRIANSLLDADVVVNLPKWKTHVKTGITGALKNFIGVNCDKEYLPHFRVGPPRRGGDEYPDSFTGDFLARLRPWLERVVPGEIIRTARRSMLSSPNAKRPLIFGGAWPGNDTLWRTVHDMVFIARWFGRGGERLAIPRPTLTLMDAIVAGEGDGPLRPEARSMNCLLFGTDSGQIDVFAAALSGIDWRSVPMLARLSDREAEAITSISGLGALPEPILALKPPAAWAKSLAGKERLHVAA